MPLEVQVEKVGMQSHTSLLVLTLKVLTRYNLVMVVVTLSNYTLEQRQTILKEARRTPDRELDGTSNWSLTTLQRTLRKQANLENLSTFVILQVLHEAGLSWQRNRTWCETGTAVRQRKHGSVVVTDEDCDAKKT